MVVVVVVVETFGRLSVRPIRSLRRVCCCGPGGKETGLSTDCCTTSGQQQPGPQQRSEAADVGSASLLADVGS